MKSLDAQLATMQAIIDVQAAEIMRMRADADPAVCRMQFPDGSVPGNAREAAEGWKKWYDQKAATLQSVLVLLEAMTKAWPEQPISVWHGTIRSVLDGKLVGIT